MNTEALFLFLILLLGLLLCSFLGGNCSREGFSGKFSGNFTTNEKSKITSSNGSSTGSSNQYDNYNHYTGGSTQLSSGSTYYGPNGVTASVVTNSNGTQSLQIILPDSSTPVTLTSSKQSSNVESYTNYNGNNGTATKFYGPNGVTASVVKANNGQQAIKVTTPSGTYYYNTSGTTRDTDTSTQYYGSTGYSVQKYNSAYGGSDGSVTGTPGNTVAGTTTSNQYYGSDGESNGSLAGTTSNTEYNSALPPGIPRNQIPSGQEDLYILKSQVVPPVCPVCPSSSTVPRQETCPPCPACARCPEPSFECKKVPNYSAIDNEYLPAPVLNDFSQFGM